MLYKSYAGLTLESGRSTTNGERVEMRITRVTTDPNNGHITVWEEEMKDPLKAGIDTLQRARILNASIEKERPYYYPKKQSLPNSWQLEMHDFILDKGVRF